MRGKPVLIVIVAALLAAVLLYIVYQMVSRPPPPPVPPLPPVAETLPGVTFIDRFTTLDAERWRVSDRPRAGRWIANDWRPSQVRAGPQGLQIELNTSGGGDAPYTSGEIQSDRLFQYGYYEAKLRVPRGRGVIVGFFTHVLPSRGQSAQEIDVEILGRDTRRIELVYHIDRRATGEVLDLGFDASEDFHHYAFEWTPDAIRWYVDNRLIHEATGERVARLNRPQRFILSLWGTEELRQWAGRIDPAEAPWRLDVACAAHAERYLGRTLC